MAEYDTLHGPRNETISLSRYNKDGGRTDWQYTSVRREDEAEDDWLNRVAEMEEQLQAHYGPESLESQLSASLRRRGWIP